jgi:hypothetical protein
MVRIYKNYISNANRELKIGNDWVEYYPKLWVPPKFEVTDSFYFDERPKIIFSIPLFGSVFVSLPIHTGRSNSCEWRAWGFYFHDDAFVLRLGKRSMYFYIPYIAMEFVGTEHLMKDDSWYLEKKLRFSTEEYREQEKFITENKKYETFDYDYKLNSGEVQHHKATVSTARRTWRRKWFGWLSKLNFVKTTIEVEFADEVGERAGSWKGGCIGTSHVMLPGETPEQTLRRMEANRRFD